MKSRLTAVLASMFVCGLALASSAHAAFPGANGKIAFVQCVPGTPPRCNIWVMNSDGTGRTNLTNNAADSEQPAWSPDGRKIAFISDRDDPNPTGCGFSCDYEIYVMNGDGAQVVRLTKERVIDTQLAWSPDGAKIAFTRNPGSPPFGIYTMNSDGSSQAELTPGAGPSWSPDGQKIRYSRFDPAVDSTTNIYSINADGTGMARVIVGGPDTEDNVEPDWAPDNAKFAFTRFITIPSDPFQPPQEGPCFDQGSCQEIWTANADGTGQTRLSASAASGAKPMDTHPAWSPDGTKILFTQTDPTSSTPSLWTMNRDGSGRTSLGPGGTPRSSSSWQSLPGPQRSDYKNAAQFCKAEKAFLGTAGFRHKYGAPKSGANAFGKCVRSN